MSYSNLASINPLTQRMVYQPQNHDRGLGGRVPTRSPEGSLVHREVSLRLLMWERRLSYGHLETQVPC